MAAFWLPTARALAEFCDHCVSRNHSTTVDCTQDSHLGVTFAFTGPSSDGSIIAVKLHIESLINTVSVK